MKLRLRPITIVAAQKEDDFGGIPVIEVGPKGLVDHHRLLEALQSAQRKHKESKL